GNVRELENVIERAVVLEMTDQILKASLPEEIVGASSPTSRPQVPDMDSEEVIDLESTLDEIEKSILLKALNKSNGIINKAAKMLNLSFRSMRYRVQKHQLKGKIPIDD
ncbi:MAG: helix-turn-helix domain-containing protein, partial [Nitrospinaceae bacterium]